MKIFYAVFSSLFFIALFFGFGFYADAQSEQIPQLEESSFVSPNIVISQFYGGGGLANAQYTHDFVELFNRGSQPVNLSGWSVQYASASGSNWLPAAPLPNVTLQPGQYFLIQFASNGANGAALTPDFIAPVVMPEGFIPNLSSSAGKIALVNNSTRLPAVSCPNDPSIVDFVGFGTAASCFEGVATSNVSATTAGVRKSGGCTDTDHNSNDFTITAPAPRNTSSPTSSCNLGGLLQASGAANPNTVSPGGNMLLTVTVSPATTPPSTGITVVGNLSSIGGATNQQFFDNGTNGDVTAGDNIFSYLATVAAGTGGGAKTVPATASDAQSRTANVVINLTVNAPATNDNPLLLGNPSNATPDIANENNYLMVKPQYSLSYNRSRATANWVAWRLDSTWIGTAPRQDDFRPDPALPDGWYRVVPEDYSGLIYDRGHMVPSGDRTRSIPDNSSTFLMTNIIPQHPDNNQGPWNDFENYLRTLVTGGARELYIFSGGIGNAGTVAQGRITLPTHTWKIVLVLPTGDNDLERISKQTRTIAILIPNSPVNRNAGWRAFRTNVDGIEGLTGYDFFSEVPKITQELIERRRDRE